MSSHDQLSAAVRCGWVPRQGLVTASSRPALRPRPSATSSRAGVEPGYLRTDFLRPVSLGLPTSTSDAYPAVREMVEQHLAMPGTQLGDPAQAAAAIIIVAATGDAPLHQLLGSDSVALAAARLQALSDDFEAARDLAVTTDIAASGSPAV